MPTLFQPLPNLTGTPVDYPITAEPRPVHSPTVFKAPAFRRALIAGVSTAAAVGIIYVFPAAVVAGGVMALAVWGGGKLADRLNDHDRS